MNEFFKGIVYLTVFYLNTNIWLILPGFLRGVTRQHRRSSMTKIFRVVVSHVALMHNVVQGENMSFVDEDWGYSEVDPAAPAVGNARFVIPPIPDPDPVHTSGYQWDEPIDLSNVHEGGGGGEGRESRRNDAKGPMTTEQANSLGILVHGQSMDEFMLTQSDMYIVRKENKDLKKQMLCGVSPDDLNFANLMREYRATAVDRAVEIFRTSTKLPDPYIQGRKWIDSLGNNDNQLPQFFNESQTYGVSAFANTILRTRDRFESLFGFGVWMETALFLDTAMTTSTAMFHDLTANVLLAGGHSGGKSYLIRAIGSTQSPGVWDPINQMSAKLLNMAGCDDARARTFDELTAEQVGAEASKNNSEANSTFKSVMTDPVMISKIANHNGESKERRGLRYVGTHYGAWFGCYDGRIPAVHSPLFNRWIFCPIEQIDATHEESIVNRMNQIKDPGAADVNVELLHAQKLRNFYIMLVNYLIWCKALPEVNMDGFRAYFSLHESSMNEQGFSLADSKKYGQLSIIARAYTVMHAVTMAFTSDVTLEERSLGENGYKDFWEVLPKIVENIACHLSCTREIAAWTFSISRMLWGNPVSSRIVNTLYRHKVLPHIDSFHPNCFESSEIAESVKNNVRSRIHRRGNATEDLGDNEGDPEPPPESREQEIRDRMAILQRDPALAAELAILDDRGAAGDEFRRCLQEEQQREAAELEQDRLANARASQQAARMEPNQQISLRVDSPSDMDDDEDDEMGLARPKRPRSVPISSENSMSSRSEDNRPSIHIQPLEELAQGDQKKTPVQLLCEKMSFQTTYESDGVKVDPNYVEICTEEHTVEAAAYYIRANSGSQKPAMENIRAALKVMEMQYVSVQILEFAVDEKNVAFIRKQYDEKKKSAVTRKMAVVRIVRNQKIHDRLGLPMPGFRIYVLTQVLLRQTTLISAVKRAIQGLGFIHTMPGRVMISTPKYISTLGRDRAGPRESTVRIFDMVRIKKTDKQFLIRNVDPISAGTRESFARLYNNSNSATKRWKPLITSQAATVYVNVEPEVIAAGMHCKNNGIVGVYAELAFPAVLEVKLAELRLTKLKKHTVEQYPQVRERAVVDINRSRILIRGGRKSLNKRTTSSIADNFQGVEISSRSLAVFKSIGAEHVDNMLNTTDGTMRRLANAGELAEEAEMSRMRRVFREHNHPLGAEGASFLVGDPDSATAVVYASRLRAEAGKKRVAKPIVDVPRQRTSAFQEGGFVPFNNANLDQVLPDRPFRASEIADERSTSATYRSREVEDIQEDLPDLSEALSMQVRWAPELESERTLNEYRVMRDSRADAIAVWDQHTLTKMREETEGALEDGLTSNTAQLVAPAERETSSERSTALKNAYEMMRGVMPTRGI